MDGPAVVGESDRVGDSGAGDVVGGVKIRRRSAVVDDPTGRRGDESATDAGASRLFVGDDREFVSMAIVDLDADSGDRSSVVAEGHQPRSVERGEPFREFVGLTLEPHAEIDEVRIHPPGGSEHACTERCRAHAEHLTEFVAQTRSIETVGEGCPDRIDGVGWDGDHRALAVADPLQRPDGAVPGGFEPSRVADDVNAG